MKKKSSFILSLVSFLLIVAAIVGTVVLVREINGVSNTIISGGLSNGDASGNSGGDSSGNSGGDSGGNSDVVVSNSYYDEVRKIGYDTVAGITYFYKVYDCPNLDYSNDCSCYFTQYDNYGGYDAQMYVYTNKLVPLPEGGYDVLDEMVWDERNMTSSSTPHILCPRQTKVAYCAISNCVRPDIILEELYANVFSTTTYIKFYHDSSGAMG